MVKKASVFGEPLLQMSHSNGLILKWYTLRYVVSIHPESKKFSSEFNSGFERIVKRSIEITFKFLQAIAPAPNVILGM